MAPPMVRRRAICLHANQKIVDCPALLSLDETLLLQMQSSLHPTN